MNEKENNIAQSEEQNASAPKTVAMPKDGFYATGRRKNSVARVWLRQGSGDITVNRRSLADYFARPVLRMLLAQPFGLTRKEGMYNVLCTVKGGGLSGQAGAIRHGIARALALSGSQEHKILRKAGFLTRDARIVERKKYGKHKARRSHQFSKR